MNKTHFATLRIGTDVTTACGRTGRKSDNVSRVDCRVCLSKPVTIEAKATQAILKAEAFQAQEPRTFREPWHREQKVITCKDCGGTKFREGDRTCYGHYANYVCASCGNTESRLTETGMSF